MLKLGDIIQGKLIEAIDDQHWIVSFNGKLLQVKNTSPLSFKKYKIIKLKITKEKPLEFKILEGQRFARRFLDLKI